MQSYNSTVEILQSDTVLVYRGSSPNLEITASFQTDDGMSSSSKLLDVSLYVIDCGDLVEHETSTTISKKTFILSENVPIFVPAGYHYYEVGSMFNFSVTSTDVPVGSNLSVWFFNNTSDATYYKYHHTDPAARAKAFRVESVQMNTSYIFSFDATYGAYFNPIFQSTGEDFDIDLSYSIVRVYYINSDYVPYPNCSLDSNKTCHIDFSSQNETCVLAYNAPRKGTVTLTTTIKTEHVKAPSYSPLCITGYVLLGIAFPVLLAIFCACIIMKLCTHRKCLTKNAECRVTQQLLPEETSVDADATP